VIKYYCENCDRILKESQVYKHYSSECGKHCKECDLEVVDVEDDKLNRFKHK